MNLKHIAILTGTLSLWSSCVFFQDLNTHSLNASEGLKSADFSYMDTKTDPASDFFQYVNGQWIQDNTIPESKSRYGSFNEVSDRNNTIIKKMLEDASSKTNLTKGSAQQLIGDYYYSILDKEKRSKEGWTPIKPIIDEINNTSKENLASLLGDLHKRGYGGVFGLYVGQDLVDNSKYVIHVSQGRQGLPDKDYYFKNDEKSLETRFEYVLHLKKMFELIDSEAPFTQSNAVMDMETSLASKSLNRLERRDIKSQYNKYTYTDFKNLFPSFNWDTYFNLRGLKDIDTIIVGQPAYLQNLETLLQEKELSDWKTYLTWSVLNRTASMLSPEIEAQNFEFYSAYLRGAKKMKPDWERAVSTMNWTMGEPLGRAFVETNFSAASKERVNQMVSHLGAALKERIAQLDWMSEATKEQAYLKMQSFVKKLGYPDKWKDMSSVDISRESYLKNWEAITQFGIHENLDKLGKPIDKEEWGMPAHIVNAYYNPAMNEIVFPAGIMQPPFFDPNAEDAVNYARMGAVIGHEMIHGFDDQGAQFDHEGKFRNWWTEEDKTNFEERTSKLAEQYDQYEVLDGVHVNGKLTLGENIADFGGLTIAYYAYLKSLEGKEKKTIHGFTPEQRFFIAFGQIWKGTATDAFLRQQVVTDPHSPVKFRVNGTLSNMPEFFHAFQIPEGSEMRNENPIVIW